MSTYVNPVPQYYLNDGSVASSGKLYFYENKDPNTKKDTFSDEGETIANTNPVPLDGEGRCPPIFGSGRYTVVFKSNKNIQQWSRDDVDLTSVLGQFADWSAIITYRVDDIVRGSDGNYYSSIVSNNLGNDPVSSPTLWEELAFLTFWNSSATYDEDDIVVHDGAFYRSAIDGNSGNQPNGSSTDIWADTTEPRDWISIRTYNIGNLVVHDQTIWTSEIDNNTGSEPGSNSDWSDISAVLSLNLRSFGFSGNYNPDSEVTSFIAIAVGGGGGGGGAVSISDTGANVGGGGGGGGSRFGIVTSPSGVYTVTIGASGSAGVGASDGGTGGDTTISGTGFSLTASGGSGGRTVQANAVTDESFSSSPGGDGGSTGSGGLFGVVGGAGTRGSGVAHPLTPGAMVLTGFPSGGGSFLCPASRAEESGVTESTTGGSSIGDSGGANTGAGGNGGINFSNSVDVQGGTGGTGFVMIIELRRG